MKILIKNATLLSMNEKREKIEKNIDILIEEDKISKVGRNLKEDETIKIIDATGKVVIPGLINTHAHVPMSIFRETLDGYSLQEWLNQKIWPMEDKLTNEDIYYASYLSFVEMIETGCTTINDMYFMTEEIIKAMLETGVRLQTTRTLMSAGGNEGSEQRLSEFIELIKKYRNKDSKLTLNAGIHGLYTTTDKNWLKKFIDVAEKENLPVHMHYCENSQEVSDIKEAYNEEPVKVLKEYFNNVNILLAHGVKITEEDMQILKNMKVSISHCPISNLKLGCGIAKVSKMLEEGINVALGTDGQGSGSSLDLFETMKFTALLQKGQNEDAKVMKAYEVLKMATINGAKALGLANEIGSIEEGKQADLILLNLDNIETKPENDLISQIVYNVKGRNVETTIVAGKILMENRKLNLSLSKEELYKKCDEIISRISM